MIATAPIPAHDPRTSCLPLSVPETLRAMTRFILWTYVPDGDQERKVPLSPVTREAINPHDPAHQVGFYDALAVSLERPSLGVGIVLANGDGLVGVDIDDCTNEHGAISPEAMEIIRAFNSYTEVSPSGTGVKIFAWGVKPESAGCSTTDVVGFKKLEVYDRLRYFALTGRHLEGTPLDVVDAQAPLDALCNRYWSPVVPRLLAASGTPVSPDQLLRRAIAYLDAIPPAISGSGGHNQTYAAATALVHGFALDPDVALDLLVTRYNPRCQPPWSEKELRHKVQDAATKPHRLPVGWLRDADRSVLPITRVKRMDCAPAPAPVAEEPGVGPVPPEMLRVPGFISEVMDYTLATAPYPNQAMAFCGALCLQASLAGRRVRDDGNTRTNIYALGLGYSSAGKDRSRRVNAEILVEAGLAACLGERMASGEGIEDALLAQPSMLVQTDEFDSMLQAIASARDGRHEALQGTLLTLYTSSGGTVVSRLKANQAERRVVEQPHLVLFGTAIPNHFYDALSDRMLTNGFFGRLMVFESGRRGAGQDHRVLPPPARVVETARWWADFNPRSGSIDHYKPEPALVERDPAARAVLAEARARSDALYSAAEDAGDPIGTTVWGRVPEHARKLALIYAVSENHREPRIGKAAAVWASALVEHQARRMLESADRRGHGTQSERDCEGVLRRLRAAPGHELVRSILLKRSKLSARQFDELIDTLHERGDIEATTVATDGRSATVYRLRTATGHGNGEGR